MATCCFCHETVSSLSSILIILNCIQCFIVLGFFAVVDFYLRVMINNETVSHIVLSKALEKQHRCN